MTPSRKSRRQGNPAITQLSDLLLVRFEDFTGTTDKLESIIHYEFVDFFRDDQNPSVLSIMKYQLRGL